MSGSFRGNESWFARGGSSNNTSTYPSLGGVETLSRDSGRTHAAIGFRGEIKQNRPASAWRFFIIYND